MTTFKPCLTNAVIRYFPTDEKRISSYGVVPEPIATVYSRCPVIATGLSLEEAVSLIKILRANAEES